MDQLNATFAKPIYQSADGKININTGHLAAVGVGMLAIYLLIPERKRKNLFK